MPIPQSIRSYLDKHKVAFDLIHHRRDYCAQETAADTHTPGKDFAKTVIVFVDESYCMCVLPATARVDLEKLKAELGARKINLATEDEIDTICPECEVGAMPPFGALYNLPVYISHQLKDEDMITFNAGTHEDAIRMRYQNLETLVGPLVCDFTERVN